MTLMNDMDNTLGLLREFSVSREETAMGFSFSTSASRKSSIDITTFVSKEDASKESPVNFMFEDYDSEVPSFELTPSVVSTLLPSVVSAGGVFGNALPMVNTNSVLPMVSTNSTLPVVNTNTTLPVANNSTLPMVNNNTLSTNLPPTPLPIDTLLRERLEGLKKEECRKRRQKRREILRIKRQKGLVSFDCPVRYRQRSEQANQRLRSSGRFVSELQYIDA